MGTRYLPIFGLFFLIFTDCSPTPISMHARSSSKQTSATQTAETPLAAKKIILLNGLTVITLENHAAPVTSVQVWVKTGSIYESHQMGAGLSHILEHMLFKGTKKRGVADIARQVEAHGGYINAYTSWDRTVYYIDLPSDGGKDGTTQGTEMAIDILADAMMDSTLPTEEYLREQKVILREMAMGRDDPDHQAHDLFFSTVYLEHPARHPVIGYEEVYRTLKRDDVIAYYKERYIPNNLIFVVVGDINATKVCEQITKLLGSWQRKALSLIYTPEEPPQITKRVAVDESRTATQQTRIHIGYPTCDFRHPNAAPLEILAMIAGNGLSSRLYQNLREKKHLVHEIDAYSYTPTWRGVLAINAITDPNKAEAARDAILAELGEFKTKSVSSSELSKALKIARSNHLSSRKTMSGLAGELASNELLTGDLTFSDKYLSNLEKVTPEDIRRVANTYLIPEALNVAILYPKGNIPKTTAVLPKVEEHPIQKITLPNGLTLLIKEDHHLPFVELRLVMKSGLLFESVENNGISQLTSKLLLKGTKKRTAADIAQEIETVGGAISPYSGTNSMGLSIEVMQPDLPLAIDIVSDIIRNSTFESNIVAHEQESQIAEIRQEREQPVKIAMQNARAKLFGSHPYSMPNLGTEQTVKSIMRDQVVAFWKHVAVPSNMVLSIFGDIQPEKVRTLTQKNLGSLPDHSLILPKLPVPNFGKADRAIDLQDKEQGVVVIAFPGIDLRNPDRARIEIMNAALSGMGSRLFLRLRDQLALCYYVGVNEMIGLDPGLIYFYIGTEPKKIAEAEKEILSEIEKLRKGGVTLEELERARNGLLGERKMQKQNLGELAMAAALDELYGLGYDYTDKLEAAYHLVTEKEVQSTAQKYLGQPSVVSIVKPESSNR